MNLTTVREIYRSRETYLDKEVQIGGWVRSVLGSKNFGVSSEADNPKRTVPQRLPRSPESTRKIQYNES